ncbi:hypothetical protein M514_05038 [Trichuris suis]|uniref:HAT C-terminal dimerisation domain-containing protein n=1 Tax=Trichuris suis TaxID=68888 RepID=A0A085NCW0_9BILA|nr:hypothetical protein M514_05038 [Trichuris suis]
MSPIILVRDFQEFQALNDEEFNRLLLHTEVSWLSKGTCLTRFYELFGSVTQFLKSMTVPYVKICASLKWTIAYLADLYFKFNEMNKQLQSNEQNLIKTKVVISAFLSKLMLFKCNFARGEFCQFPTLAKVSKEVKIPEDDVHIYCQHLEMLQEDFLRRFHDILSLEELIDLQSNEETKPRMARGYEYFWLHQETPLRYPALWAAMKRLLIFCCYGSRHEEAESPRSSQSGDSRLRVTSLQPNIERIVGLHASCSSE